MTRRGEILSPWGEHDQRHGDRCKDIDEGGDGLHGCSDPGRDEEGTKVGELATEVVRQLRQRLFDAQRSGRPGSADTPEGLEGKIARVEGRRGLGRAS